MHDITRLPLLDSPACAALCDAIDGMRLQWLDRQFEDIPWQHPGELDFDQPVSFTLPLRLPAAGGGLNTWPADWRHCHDSPLLIPELLARSLECHRVAYTDAVEAVLAAAGQDSDTGVIELQVDDAAVLAIALARTGWFLVLLPAGGEADAG